MKLSSCLLASFLSLSSLAMSQSPSPDQGNSTKHPWLIRVRALNMTPANTSRAFSALGDNFATNSVSLNDKLFPELDVSYFFTKNWAAELVLSYPQQHDVYLAGVGKLGTVSHLPPTLVAQYHWPIEKCPVTPYVSLGVNYTFITAADIFVAGTGLTVTKNSFGPAYGIGLDYKLSPQWSLNVDFKHVTINTNVKVQASGATLTDLGINPNLLSVGVGYRF